jgi:hypothetical protein
MVEAGLDAFGNVENAAREAVVSVRNFLRVNLDGPAARKKCHFEFLRGGFVFDFFDIWVAAAHELSPSNSASDMLNAQLLNGVANWGAALLRPYEENLDFGQLAAFERRRDGGIHQ